MTKSSAAALVPRARRCVCRYVWAQPRANTQIAPTRARVRSRAHMGSAALPTLSLGSRLQAGSASEAVLAIGRSRTFHPLG
eukprot:357645-Chlamydomonas_euryale.AAC.7